MQWLALGVTALSAMQSYNQAAGQAAFTKAQVAWQNKQNLMRLRLQGQALDTNIVRARTETATALQTVSSSAHEAAAQARVAQAAASMGTGSADTLLNSFARKQNQAEGNIIQQLVSELASDVQKRDEIGITATANQAIDTSYKPSLLGSALGAAQDYFKMTYGLKDAFTLGGGSGSSTGTAPSALNDAGVAGYGVFSKIKFF